jgi:MoxR-like ATPase
MHPMFTTLLKACNVRGPDGYRLNIWIAGPPGSGKTTGAFKACEALGLPVEYTGAFTQSHEALGYRGANGDYLDTAFFRGYTGPKGHVFDDIDGSDPNATVSTFGALANGRASFPHGIFERHVDSLLIATGNTWGAGATSALCGRNKMDSAFLDRFPIKLFWDYDEKFERSLYGSEAAEITQSARRVARDRGFKDLWITPRTTGAVAALLANGFTHDEAKNLTYRAGLTAEQVRSLP